MIGLETIVECDGWPECLPDAAALAERIHRAAREREPAIDGAAALLLTDDAALAALNSRFRGKDAPTNVLSFPSGDAEGEFLGDIALAFETCRREAAEQGKSLADHAAHLIAHGLLHLAGYDHETDEEALVMEAKEVEILAALGIENPYKER